MVWHILKKDFKLLWLFVLAIATMQFAIVAVHVKLGQLEENELLHSLLFLLELMLYFGVACLIATLVHQDAIVGMRQDWLVRPIKRSHLLAAKFLLLLMAIQLPMLLATVAGSFANGFPLAHSLPAALSENLYFLVGFTLPILAFASITQNMTEALAGSFALFVVVMGLQAILMGLNGGLGLGPTTNTGIEWIPQTGRFLIYLLGATAILGLQYFYRRTRISRFVFGAIVVLCLLTEIIPWPFAYSLQKAISKMPTLGGQVAFRFEPGVGRFQSPLGVESQPDFHRAIGQPTEGGRKIYLPLQIFGLPPDSMLKVDRAVAHIVPANGRTELLSFGSDSDDFEVPEDAGAKQPSPPYYEPIRVRDDVYNRLKDTPVTVQVDYSITLLMPFSVHTLPSLHGNQHVPGVGWCQTGLNESQTAILVVCSQAGNFPDCINLFLQNPNTQRQNPTTNSCLGDYAPYYGRYKPPDTIMHMRVDLDFRDTADLVHYPVDGPQIGNSHVVMKSYEAKDHFTTRLVIPGIRLRDWTAP